MKQEAPPQRHSRTGIPGIRAGERVKFAAKYGPWALVAGASDGVGAAFAEGLAERGVNVVLVARRQGVLDEVAAGIRTRTGVQTRTLAVDLAQPSATAAIVDAAKDLEVGCLVYCPGSDPNFEPFLANSIQGAEAMVVRNCVAPMQLCHHFAPAMVERGRGGIVIFGSGAGFVGGPNIVTYSATKAFDMVFAEALWTELHDKGIDVLGLILGKTDTPALRRLEHSRGQISSVDEPAPYAATVAEVIAEAFDNLANGPTWIVGDTMRAAYQMIGSATRNEAVQFMARASAAAMGSDQ
jgi:short-subunit dehydrogenase